ncbi:MAG: cation:proton antiporter [Muribaculaceae bacterium]|nr:cation:proton antiporter [Muribaculaceae bacterium]MBP5314994.1 cation:proton antiporter [Muribaculaceae bacterium]MBR4721832.1 cation:proton antiporter [Muribaculaceae bacterium]MBR5436763.1 cation:proton antiporter [Muribaculaceae bacterium]MBR5744283.1 cation:proton antiporter [Muribaculaceae bacterium]
MILAAATALVTDPVLIFFIVLAIILLTPLIFNRLNIPHIIGLILAGVIIGPYCTHLLDYDMSFKIFGQVGIIYLMFLAGLEIDMYNMKKNFNRGFVYGMYTFFIPLVIGFVVGYYIMGLKTSTTLLLCTIYAAQTLVAYPIVSRLGLTKSPAVIITITGTIVTVFLSLLLLAGVVEVEDEGGFFVLNSMLVTLAKFAVYALAVLYVYPRLTRWFIKKFSDNSVQVIYILAMVFLAGYMARMIGLEPILGAFFAGIVLNRYVPAMSPLMSRLEFLGNTIFIPYFLIGVGMLINLPAVVSSWDTAKIAVIMTVIGLLTKWLPALVVQKVYKFSAIDRRMIFGLSSASAAAAIAAVMIGYQIGIADDHILNGTVLMILITCVVSSLVTSSAAKKMKMAQLSQKEVDTRAGEKGGNVLIPVANPITAKSLVELALLMRDPLSSSKIFALHVRSDNSAGSRAIGRNSLDVAEQTAATSERPLMAIERYDMNIVTGIVNTVVERDISQIIIGLHRRVTVIDSFFGAKVEQLLKSTNRMLVISRCFIPVNTVTRIVVSVPPKAEFEAGFALWVKMLANLASQLGCRIIFCCYDETKRYIRSVIFRNGYRIRSEYREMHENDDFILLADKILDDDLFVMVTARHTSVSFNTEMDSIPSFLQKYFSQNNLLVVYPDQYGDIVEPTSFVDPLTSDINDAVSPLWLKLRSWARRLIEYKNRYDRSRQKHHKPKDVEL